VKSVLLQNELVLGNVYLHQAWVLTHKIKILSLEIYGLTSK
jgi:hypothetical protein